MASSLKSLIKSGTKLWLDSVDPELVTKSYEMGATGATSNPIIIADLFKSGKFDDQITALLKEGLDDESIAWEVTDRVVKSAQDVFLPVWTSTSGNDGYVSFELDPLLEDLNDAPAHDERVKRYIELAKKWNEGHKNRMIKVPATPAGLAALEEMVAAGITVNVTLIFSSRQYKEAREAVHRGAKRRNSLESFKSVYSIFVSRLDVYTEKHVSSLSSDAQGLVGIVNAKRLWQENQNYWKENQTPLQQEIIFASTGTKKPEDPPHKYVKAFAGSDIETNPPGTNDAVEAGGVLFEREIEKLPSKEILDDIDEKVDFDKLEKFLMEEGLKKFAEPQKALIKLVAEKRSQLG